MGKDWREELARCFEDIRILDSSKQEARDNFDYFCKFTAAPAFVSLKEELDQYRPGAKTLRSKGQSITFQINFVKSNICQFQYTVLLPKNSIQLELITRVVGRKNKRALLEGKEFSFMRGIAPSAVMGISQEDFIRDVIEHYRNFLFASVTSAE